MKSKSFIVVFIALISFLISCKDRRQHKAQESPNPTWNIIIVLDLSDRILVKHQADIDKELINFIYSQFEQKVKKRIFIYSKDKLKIAVADQKEFTVDPILLKRDLNFDLTALPTGDKGLKIKRDYMINFKSNFGKSLNDLYASAMIDTSSKQFKGADIWKYFNQNLEFDLKSDSLVKNYVFVFTDGYFDFEDYKQQKTLRHRYSNTFFFREIRIKKNTWDAEYDKGDYGLIDIHKNFENASVMVLEINPKNDFFDESDLIKKTWSKWLREMHITHFELLQKNRIEVTKEQIVHFISE